VRKGVAEGSTSGMLNGVVLANVDADRALGWHGRSGGQCVSRGVRTTLTIAIAAPLKPRPRVSSPDIVEHT